MKKAERLAKARKELEDTLQRVGYTGLRQAGIRSKRPDFPDYSCPSAAALPTNGFGMRGRGLPPPRSGAHAPDAIQFPVGNLHKSGLQMIPNTKDPEVLKHYGGKKPT